VGLDDQGIVHQFQAREKVFCHLQSTLTSSEAIPTSYSVHALNKRPGLEANLLSVSSARGRMCGAVCAVPPHPSTPSLWSA
jgi:hypothetical protein